MTLATLLTAGQATAAEELELGSLAGWGWSKKSIVISDVEIPQLPATVKLPGQYGEISVTEKFDAKDIASFKVTFGQAIEAGKVQISIRNQAQTSSYQNQYIHLEGGITEYTGDIDLEMLGDDTEVVSFAFMNDGNQDDVEVIINDFVFVKSDGTEWRPTWKGSGWPTGSLTSLTEVPGAESKDVYEFTNQYGEVGVDFGETVVLGEDKHFIRLESSEPLPEGFQWKVYWADGSNAYPAWELGGNSTTVEMTADYTGISIQHTASTTSTLPQDIKLYREVKYADGAILREWLPIVANTYSDDAKIIDPNPAAETGENGLPVRLTLSSQWQAIGLWKEAFSVAEYPMYKIMLREKPADGLIQLCYRNEAGGSQGGVYVPWETNEEIGVTVSEDGTTITGEFNIDELGDDTEILAFFMQNRTGDNFSSVLEGVWLMNEDEEWIPTPGLGSASSIWNTGTTLPVGGSYDDEGNIWDAYVEYYSTNSALGYYNGTVDEGTYHKVTFYTEEPLPAELVTMAYNLSFDADWNMSVDAIETQFEGIGTNQLSILIPRSYQYLVVQYFGEEAPAEPLRVHFTKIERRVYEGELVPVAIKDINSNVEAQVNATEYYNTAGVRMAQPSKGISIVRETLSNGTVRARKVMVK